MVHITWALQLAFHELALLPTLQIIIKQHLSEFWFKRKDLKRTAEEWRSRLIMTGSRTGIEDVHKHEVYEVKDTQEYLSYHQFTGSLCFWNDLRLHTNNELRGSISWTQRLCCVGLPDSTIHMTVGECWPRGRLWDGDLWIGSIGRFRFMRRMGGWWRR